MPPRRALASDVPSLVRLRAAMFEAMGIPDTHTAWQLEASIWFQDRIANPDYGIFVIDASDEVVACAMGAIRDAAPSPTSSTGRDVLISNVCTAAEHRGQGHGRAVFEAVIHWAQQTGISRAELMATDQGRGMYERAGFVGTHFPAMRADLTQRT